MIHAVYQQQPGFDGKRQGGDLGVALGRLYVQVGDEQLPGIKRRRRRTVGSQQQNDGRRSARRQQRQTEHGAGRVGHVLFGRPHDGTRLVADAGRQRHGQRSVGDGRIARVLHLHKKRIRAAYEQRITLLVRDEQILTEDRMAKQKESKKANKT